MDKIWYYVINGSTQGPFLMSELINLPGFTPDSLVWREGFSGWMPAKDVREIDEIFKDKGSESGNPVITPVVDEAPPNALDAEGDVVVFSGKEPPFYFIWLLIALIMFSYVVYQLYFNA